MVLSRQEIITERKIRKLKQKDFAKLLNVSQTSMCQFERGHNNSDRIRVRATEYFTQNPINQ